jgi:tetratricopeptide (TPR) repeat protein
MRLWAAGIANLIGLAELAAGDLATAESELRESADELAQMGESGIRSTVVAYLARTLCHQGRDREAEQLATESLALSAGDVINEIVCGGVRARVAAHRGDFETAVALAEAALGRVRALGHEPVIEVHMDLAEVLRFAGEEDRAAAALEAAVRLYTEKGNVASAARARTLMERAIA